MEELKKKIKDIEEEINMPKDDFEIKITDRLNDEVKLNKLQFDEELKRGFQEEKKRVTQQIVKEKENLKMENRQLAAEIQRLKVMLRTLPK